MDGVNLFALVLAGILEGELGDTRGSLFGNDFQTLDYARHNLVLKAGVKAFSILADDDEVDIRIARGDMRQVPYGTEVSVKFKFLSQRDVNARETASHGRCDRTLQADAGAFQRRNEVFGDVFAVLLVRFGTDDEGFPLEFDPGRFQNADDSVCNLGADSVARD